MLGLSQGTFSRVCSAGPRFDTTRPVLALTALQPPQAPKFDVVASLNRFKEKNRANREDTHRHVTE
jgi:hypothetical protein